MGESNKTPCVSFFPPLKPKIVCLVFHTAVGTFAAKNDVSRKKKKNRYVCLDWGLLMLTESPRIFIVEGQDWAFFYLSNAGISVETILVCDMVGSIIPSHPVFSTVIYRVANIQLSYSNTFYYSVLAKQNLFNANLWRKKMGSRESSWFFFY